MENLNKPLSNIQSHHSYHKVLYWAKNVSITTIAQIFVQGLGFLSGILIIRLLPAEEYAFYTLANTMLGTMTVLADGGITTGVMSQGGKVWQDKQKLGMVVATGFDLRKKFAAISLIVSVPILLYLLIHNEASWITAVLIILSLIPAFYAALSDSLLEIVPKLHQSISPLQNNQIMVSVGRVVLSFMFLFIFPWAFVAILSSGIPRIYGNLKLRKISSKFLDEHQLPDQNIRVEILSIVKKLLPLSIYYTVSEQITIWLVSFFGNTTVIAQIGALTRIAVLLSVLSALLGTLIIPRFARALENKSLLLKRYILVHLLVLGALSLILFVVWMLPSQILWILGSNYSNLEEELLISIAASCFSLMSGVSFSLYSSRGWAMNAILGITLGVVTIIIGALIFDMSQLIGALYYSLFIAVSGSLINFIFGLIKINKIKLGRNED